MQVHSAGPRFGTSVCSDSHRSVTLGQVEGHPAGRSSLSYYHWVSDPPGALERSTSIISLLNLPACLDRPRSHTPIPPTSLLGWHPGPVLQPSLLRALLPFASHATVWFHQHPAIYIKKGSLALVSCLEPPLRERLLFEPQTQQDLLHTGASLPFVRRPGPGRRPTLEPRFFS